jgi:hypothetical protein
MNVELLILEKLYKDAAEKLIATIERKSVKGGLAIYERSVLREVSSILQKLSKDAEKWVNEFVPAEYLLAANETIDLLKESLDITHSITQLDKEAINALVRNASGELLEANQAIGRRVQGLLRDIQINNVMGTFARGLSAAEVKKAVLKDLMENGLLKVPDSAGRQWDARAYANMVGRSATAEARNVGRLNTLTQTENDLVQVSKHSSACPICSRLEGRVYSISGNDKRFPALYSTAFGNGYNLIHPGCLHNLIPFILSLKTPKEIEKAEAFSNRPFDIDPRSERVRQAYAKGQAAKRKARETRMQFERYRTVLKDKAPKTLAGFSSIKAKNGEAWKKLQSAYRSVQA